MKRLYEAIDVWRRAADRTLIRYRCFRVHPDGGYCVQSADYYREGDTNRAQLEDQFLELLAEEPPDRRSRSSPDLSSAIEAFDSDFAEDPARRGKTDDLGPA